MDYGIISLLLIQLTAVMGSIAAYIRMRTQTDAIKSMRDNSLSKCSDVELRIEKLAAIMAEREEKFTKYAGNIDKLQDLTRDLIARVRELDNGEETTRAAIKSIKAAMSAFSRHARRNPPEDEDDDIPVPVPVEQENMFPPVAETPKRVNFGKSAV